MDDLKYLAEYDPVCFEKTCKNIIYKMPETKKIFKPEAPPSKAEPALPPTTEESVTDKQKTEAVLDSLGKMEELPVSDVKVEAVKNLLGDLYMELLFPHNDRAKYFSMEESESLSTFNKRV